MTDPTSCTTGTIRSALGYPRFRRLLGALAVSQAGDWLYNVALLALVFERTHSATWLSVTTAARLLPMVLLGPVAGVITDRFDRRRLMIGSDVIRVALMLALAAVGWWTMPIALAPLLAAAATGAASVYPSCVGAITPRLVDDADLPGANAARSATQMLCIVVGPGIGAALLFLLSPAGAIVANAATFAASAVLVALIPTSDAFHPERGTSGTLDDGVWSQLRAGAAALRRQRLVMRCVRADVLCSVVYGANTVLLLLLARHLGDGAQGYGYLMAGAGAGGVLGTALSARLAGAHRLPLVLAGCLALVGLPGLGFAVADSLWLAMLCAVLGGAGAILVEVVADTLLQREVDDSLLGRVYSWAFSVSIGGICAGAIVAGPLVALVGLQAAFVLIAAAVTGYAGVVLLGAREHGATPAHGVAAMPTAPAVATQVAGNAA
ncbi:MAG: MFS transporter [Nocardioidaceae bacterium]